MLSLQSKGRMKDIIWGMRYFGKLYDQHNASLEDLEAVLPDIPPRWLEASLSYCVDIGLLAGTTVDYWEDERGNRRRHSPGCPAKTGYYLTVKGQAFVG